MAVASGNWGSHVRLVYCYMFGDGMEKNVEEALRLCQLAAQSHDDSEITALGSVYGLAEGVRRDEEKAVNLYGRSKHNGYGYGYAEACLGRSYLYR